MTGLLLIVIAYISFMSIKMIGTYLYAYIGTLLNKRRSDTHVFFDRKMHDARSRVCSIQPDGTVIDGNGKTIFYPPDQKAG